MNKFEFFKLPKSIDKAIDDFKKKPATHWEKLGKRQITKLANFVIENVPAYREFLKDNDTSFLKVRNIGDFKKLPLTSKDIYLKNYSYDKLFPRGHIDRVTTVSSTSGSTGKPFYFPRGEEQDWQYEFVAEVFLKNQFELDKKRTLGIIGFGLGIWIGGIFTYKNLNKIASKGYRLALAPVGTNKQIYLETFKKFADCFDQIILMGYPPFIKDVVDEAKDYGINWRKYEIKILNATEAYSEKFREYLIKKIGIKNRYKDVLNIYGTVELGTMSHETPIANLIRKIAVDKPKVFEGIFPGATVVPTLAQYYPNIVYFEEVGGEIVASGFGSSFPLLRYRFFDQGSVLPFNVMIAKLKKLGIDIYKYAKEAKIEKTIMRLPFVYVYGRSDFVVILRGANIYPENIKMGLQHKALERYVTGKFTMVKREDYNGPQKLDHMLR
ncbi:hypothetical protein KKB40_05770 [Patescibacteria group bacterium]|nr:hypothetical protein [Patescibacteria group bacterium]